MLSYLIVNPMLCFDHSLAHNYVMDSICEHYMNDDYPEMRFAAYL